MNVTYLVLATECLTKNVAQNPSIGLFIPCIMLMQFFLNLTPTFRGWVFKQMEIKCRWFQYSLELSPGTVLCLCLLSSLVSSFPYFSNPHAPILVSGILVEAGLRHFPALFSIRKSLLKFTLCYYLLSNDKFNELVFDWIKLKIQVILCSGLVMSL